MIITKTEEGNGWIVSLEGRLDATAAPDLEKEMDEAIGINSNVIFDFQKLSYISSAGLRVLLSCQKKIKRRKGSMIIRHVNVVVKEVFDVTGFSSFLTVEE